jgi:hypothetical protein
MSKMGLHDPFGHLKHKLWPKEGSGVPPISWCVGGMRHTIGKISTRATTLLQTSSQSEVCTQSYEPPKLQESQLWKFRDSHLGVSEQNGIWVLVPWLVTKYIIRGKVVASPKSKLWWVLWVHVYPWRIRAPKCSNYTITNLLFGFVCVSNSIVCQSS